MNVILGGAVVVSFLVALIAAAVIIFRAPKEQVRRWLACFLLFAASWGLVINLQNTNASLTYNLWIVQLTFIASLLMVYSLFRFALAVTRTGVGQLVRYVFGGLTIIGILATLGGVVVESVSIQDGMVSPVRLVGYYLVIVYILVASGYSVGLVVRKYHKSPKGVAKRRLGIVAFGLAQGIILGIITNVILPNLLGDIEPARYAWVSITLWTVILVYAVVRHQFLDIRLAVVRSVAYFMVLATMVAVYFGLAFLLSGLLRNSFSDPAQVTASAAIALILALIFQPIKRFFDHWTNRIFYHESYDTDDFLARLGELLSKASDLRELLQNASREIRTTLQAEQVFFLVRSEGRKSISSGTNNHSQVSKDDIRLLDEYIIGREPGIIITNLLPETDDLFSLLSRHKIAITLPLFYGEGVKSYLFIGERRSRQYTQRDIRVLETISDELLIAIQNMISVQEVRDINATLNQRIEDATKELRTSNAQLQRLDAAKDEFVSMASHQLRTPLTSVKGYLSMVLEGDVGKLTTAQRKVLNEAFISSERMVHLINDFLNVSRIQTGKFILERRAVDLSKMVNQEVDSLQTTAHVHNLKLKYRQPSHFPILYVDENKLRQVLMNFIDNAIYYSHEGTTIDIKLEAVEGDVVLTVHDTGIGVPKSEQAHLFSKFFRATNARKQRPDGTGVGLFLAKKVIDAHGGSMVFESVEGEGSTFGFRLPIKKLSTAPDDNTDKLDK